MSNYLARGVFGEYLKILPQKHLELQEEAVSKVNTSG